MSRRCHVLLLFWLCSRVVVCRWLVAFLSVFRRRWLRRLSGGVALRDGIALLLRCPHRCVRVVASSASLLVTLLGCFGFDVVGWFVVFVGPSLVADDRRPVLSVRILLRCCRFGIVLVVRPMLFGRRLWCVLFRCRCLMCYWMVAGLRL